MEKELLSKKDLLLYAKNATQSILNSLVAIKFINAKIGLNRTPMSEWDRTQKRSSTGQ